MHPLNCAISPGSVYALHSTPVMLEYIHLELRRKDRDVAEGIASIALQRPGKSYSPKEVRRWGLQVVL